MAMLVVAAPAQKKAKKTKKAAKVEAVQPKVDTVSLDVFSYAMGMAQQNGLKKYLAQRLDVDTINGMGDFLRGVKEVFAAPQDKKLVAYSAGLQVGSQILGQFLKQLNQQITGEQDKDFIDVAKYKDGFLAGVTGENALMSLDSATQITSKQMEYYKEQEMERKYGENRVAGEEFLKANAKKDSIVTLPSGLQYKILKVGEGPKPTANQTVSVNYEGTLIDGTVFDSSYKRGKPASFRCNQVIKGWTEALQLMPVGSTWMLYIPQEMAYGSRETGGLIKPFSALIFKVELLGIEPDKQ